MPRTTRTPATVTNAGVAEAFTAVDAGNGETIPLDGNPTVLVVKNSGGGAGTVTLSIAQKVDGQTPAAKTVNVPATTGDVSIKLGPTGIYQQADLGQWIDYSGGTLTAWCYKLAPPYS